MYKPDSDSDFRDGMIQRRLELIDRIILITSGKGGVGKSVVAATIATLMARAGMSVGLFDADMYGPSVKFIFGVDNPPLEERHGLTPPISHGVKIMSVDFFASGKPLPVGGKGARQIIKELLALTNWGKMDCLLVDMPPGTGDILMALLKVIENNSDGAIIITVPSALSTSVVRRVIELLQDTRIPIFGVLENMSYLTDNNSKIRPLGQDGGSTLSSEFGVKFFGELPIDYDVVSSVDMANIPALLNTKFAETLLKLLESSNLIIESK